MRFAVVEYSSKSGDVWQHTEDRPNYLANPATEIDPTSFGCYVSALQGVHIPLVGLIVGPVNPVAQPLVFYRKVVKRLTKSWPRYSLDYLRQFDVILMVHQLSDAHEVVAATERLRRYPDAPFIIGVPTQPYGLLKEAVENDADSLEQLKAFIASCDVFVSVVQETVGWYEDLSQTPVRYLPQPYPTHYAERDFLPREKKQPEILVAGVTQREAIIQGQIVAKELQKRHPEYRIRIPKVADYSYDFSHLAGATYDVLPFETWQDHLQTLAKTTLVINTDYTLTRGRVQTDCAAVGTPSLGGNSDGTRDLFPSLRSNPTTSVEELVTQGDRLLTDTGYYGSIVTYASDRLKKYDYEESAARLQLLVNEYRENN